jgi:redox-sensitive bicupin YhaK (pirin superfamily)
MTGSTVAPESAAPCLEHASPGIEFVIRPRARDLGGFNVSRLLPAALRRRVGPFIFFDYFGPLRMAAGTGLDVRPHPHIALATVTYLFEGEIVHRDSLGSLQVIRPGDVNWMVAGRGIVHSERTSEERRSSEHGLHGVQAWVALPTAQEEIEPAFFHHAEAELPQTTLSGVELRVVAGTGFGLQSPVRVASPTFYVDARFGADTALEIPTEHAERAVCVVQGTLSCAGDDFVAGDMLILRVGEPVTLHARAAARVLLLGGAPIEGERHLWWNFVSSSLERLERAKSDWRDGRFPVVPGDETEFIPLPEP